MISILMAAFYLNCKKAHHSTIHVDLLGYDGCLWLYLLAIAWP